MRRRSTARQAPTVFLCWSGTRSRKVAGALEAAIRELNPDLEAFSSPGIGKGSVWFEEVRKKLDQAVAAIVCLTPENAKTPWIHFEAGAVAAKMVSKTPGQVQPRVYPFLFRMEGARLDGPECDPHTFEGYQGLATHANFRSDKWDIGPAFDWDRLGL